MVIGVVPKRITVVDRQNALTSGLFQVTTPYFYDPINGAIQPVGLVTQAPSLRGPLYNFDGSSYLKYVNDRRLTPPYSVVCDVIFRTVGFDVFQPVVSQGGGGATLGFKVAIASNGLRSTFGGVFDYFISGSFSANTMYRVCVTVSGNGGTAIAYVNGSAIGSVAVGTMLTPASTGTLIGADAVGGRVLNGTRIGNVALWNRALSADEVLLLNNSSLLSTQPRYVQTDSTPSPTSRTFFVPNRKTLSTQPTSSVAIDWGSPITRGLVTAYVPSDRSPARELVTGANDSASTRLSVGPGLRGVRGFNTGASTAWSLTFAWATRWPHPNGVANYPALTVFALFEQYDTTSSGAIWGGGNNSTQYANFFKSNDGSVVFGPNTNSGGASINGPVLDTNRVYALVGVNEGNYRELFVDGNSVISSNTSITFLNAAYTFAGSTYVANQFRRIGLYCGYVWTRRLAVAEIKSLSENPWQIFKQPRLSPALAEDGKVYAPFMS